MLKILLQRIGRWFQCHIMDSHEWTCDAQEGIKPDHRKLKLDFINYFEEYTRMYCKHCPKEVRRDLLN